MCYNYTILLLQKMSLAYIISKLLLFLITKRESFFPQVAKKKKKSGFIPSNLITKLLDTFVEKNSFYVFFSVL